MVFSLCRAGLWLLCMSHIGDVSSKGEVTKRKRALFSRKYNSLAAARSIFFLDQEESYSCFRNKDIRLPLL